MVYGDWRDRVAHRRRHATGQFIVADRLIEDRVALRPLPPTTFDFSLSRTVRVPADAYLRYAGCFYPAPVELVHQKVASAIGVVPLAPRTALSLAWATLATRAHLRRLDLSGQARLCLPLQFPRILETRRRTAVRVLWSLVRQRPLLGLLLLAPNIFSCLSVYVNGAVAAPSSGDRAISMADLGRAV